MARPRLGEGELALDPSKSVFINCPFDADYSAVSDAIVFALVIFWVGCLKFTDYESKGVFTHASNSPLLSWAYQILDIRNFSRALGVIEITLAVLIATRYFWPKVSAIGSLGAIVMFLTTLSFLLTTPGVWEPGYGFPSLSGAPGQFLAKDVVLLGAALWTAGEALLAAPDPYRSTRIEKSGSGQYIAA